VPFGQSNIYSLLDFCPRLARKKGNIFIPLQGVIAISGKKFNLTLFIFILLVLKLTMYQQKALDLSFNFAP
jgi:hypothetical protein